jgi:hypothetical protein
MRTLLTSATLAAGMVYGTAVLAQAPAPAPAAPPDTTMQPDQSAPAPDATAAAPMAPKKHHWHKKAVAAGTGDDADSGHWAHQPGTGMSGPASSKASNIGSADTRSTIAPHLPAPAAGDGAGPEVYLRDAAASLDKHQTGAAQQALEMAETRILTRSTPVSTAGQPAQDPMIQNISDARKALGTNDIAGAKAAIQAALSHGT